MPRRGAAPGAAPGRRVGAPRRASLSLARPVPYSPGMSGTLPTVVVRRARPEDLPRIEALLAAERLPLEGVREHLEGFLCAVTAGGLIGAIGMELHGEAALLRSAVVEPGSRRRGIAALLTLRLVEDARRRGARAVYLLTETATGYFERAGFRRVAREEIPAALHASAEFRGACPDTAVCMVKPLD